MMFMIIRCHESPCVIQCIFEKTSDLVQCGLCVLWRHLRNLTSGHVTSEVKLGQSRYFLDVMNVGCFIFGCIEHWVIRRWIKSDNIWPLFGWKNVENWLSAELAGERISDYCFFWFWIGFLFVVRSKVAANVQTLVRRKWPTFNLRRLFPYIHDYIENVDENDHLTREFMFLPINV